MLREYTKFRNLKIHKQFFIISSITFILVCIFSGFMIYSTKNTFLNNVTNYADLSAEKFSNELDTLCLQMDVVSSQFQNDDIYQELFSCDSYKSIDISLIDDVSKTVNTLKLLNGAIVDVAFANQVIHWSSIFTEDDLDFLYTKAISNSKSLSHAIGLYKSSIHTLASNTYYIYCSKIYENAKVIGCVFISLNVSDIPIYNIDTDSPASFYLMDSNYNIYSLNSNAPLDISSILGNINLKDESDKYIIAGNDYSIQVTYSSTAECYYISVINVPKVNQMVSGTLTQIWILLIAILAFILILFFILYKNMINPLNQFANFIQQIELEKTRHLADPIKIDGCEEVRNLSETFTNMFSTIDNLNIKIFETSSKLYEEKIRGQATEISFFRSQINPHFLYNVLELIRSLALSHNVPEIANIAIAMGKMYRYNTKGSDIVPFKDELEMTKAYIEIQQYRFKDKIDVFYNIPETTLDIPVIKMILQPIVENAIQHGIEPSMNSNMLYIGCTVSDNIFYIEIRDDGIGINQSTLLEIRELLSDSNHNFDKYIGLVNTNSRIKLQYGTQYGISIESKEGDGTVVTLALPLSSKGEK